MNLDLNAGYSRFSGDTLEGPNGSVLFVPGLRFGESFSLLPVLTADYLKSRDVQDLAGGGFLTSAQHSRGVSLRAIQDIGLLKLKAYGAYKQTLLKEVSEEPWGEGLFDYDKTAFGLEAEVRPPLLVDSVRGGVDYYKTVFPNFRSLASGSGAELNTGTKVLDFSAVDVPLSAEMGLGRQILNLKSLVSIRSFDDQNVIQDDGSFSNDKRSDLYWSLAAGLTRVLPKRSLWGELESAASVDLAYGVLDSNQNSFDVTSTTPRPNFYSYSETSVGPRWQFRWRKWMTGSLSYLFSRRDYADRPAQLVGGADKGESIVTDTQTFRWSFGFPLSQGFSIQLRGAFQHADSNMENETTYRYNYSSSHHFLGFAWEL